MAIKQKAKRYDEALRKARDLYLPSNSALLEEIFPELIKSNDEKIRGAIIHFISHTPTVPKGRIDKKTMLTWLEKQGQKETAWNNEYDKDMLGAIEYCIKNNRPLEKEHIAWLEKQKGEQKQDPCENCKDICLNCQNFPCIEKREFEQGKPALEAIKEEKVDNANKVEPEFKVGDWVVSPNGVYWRIDKISNNRYEVISNTGESSNWSLDTNIYHRFTIQDASDGDVLAAHECLVLFKKLDGLNIKCYCTYHYMGFSPSFYVDTLQNKDAFHPATKEQRDTLMKAMADAGYTFDFKKKELNKIESDLTEFENTLADVCRGWIGEELGWKDYIIKNSLPLLELAKKQFDEYEQKPDNKVEPKFKVGNWYQCTKDFFGKGVTFDKNTAYYCAQEGCLQNEYGCHIAIVKDLYDYFKLWTILDANEGDVLANDHHILILKELVYEWSSNGTPDSVKAYCGIKPNGNFEIGKDNWCFCGTLHIHPATKEQRDTLMKAMADAGYEFNFEKKELKMKELKMIEQKQEENKGNLGGISSNWSEEDEKMRKELIRAFKSLNTIKVWNGIERTDILAWLEKLSWQNLIMAKSPQLGGQKPNNKVEPKFYEREWITNGDYTWKIVEVKPLDYILQSQDGNIVDDTISHVDEQFHSFTIKDAKDGDVLYCESGWTCIFKTLINDETFSSYCFMDKTKWFCETGSECHTLKEEFIKAYNGKIHPATKEQRDTLFAKMKEAGYEWDAEKKKLEKIEDKKHLLSDFFKAEYERRKADAQKSAWSEEDEDKLKSILFHIEDVENKDVINWLKSLKDRVQPQPKQEWGEEDERNLNDAILFIETGTYSLDKDNLINWLKSFRSQKQWKPSEEQMIALHQAISGCSYDIELLVELETKLKEL